MNIVHYLPRIRLAEGGVVRAVLDICTLAAGRGHGVGLVTHDPADAPWHPPSPDPGGGGGRARGAAGGVDHSGGPMPDLSRAGSPAHPPPGAGEGGVPRLHVVPAPALPAGLFSGAQLRALRPLIAACDVLHLHTPWERANIQLAAIGRRERKPYVVSIHGMLDDWSMGQHGPKKRLFLALAGRRLLERAAAVHCTAEAEKTQSQRWYPRGRPVVIPLVFDLTDFRTLPGPEIARRRFLAQPPGAEGPPTVSPPPGAGRGTEDHTLLFLSRLHPKKGVEHLIDAAAILRDRGLAFRVLIAGTGEPAYERALRARVASARLDDRVRFLGLVTGVEKVSLYQAADLFILPTSQENFGFVLPEALACGTPALTTRGVDIWPDLERSNAAVIVDPLTPAALADAAAALLADPARRAGMGRAGREWVLRTLDPGEVVRAYEALYARAAAGRALESAVGPPRGR